ncbi:hypothetical protein [Brevundimonas sp.]|uniref:hypothetical protein n=1 Tax=Brevundimonas sp. TaxID=1871086 RepID=UPI002FCC1533
MSASNKRPVAGSRSPARSKASADASRRMRMGLLGSTALIAASLAVSPAFAQIATPAGGGTITRTGGSSTTDDQTGAGGGVLISAVSQSAAISVNGVTIDSTTGAPSADALRILGSTSGLNSTGVTLTGVNTLTTTTNGGAGLYVSTNANMGLGITSSGSVFTGSYGINLLAASGYISFDASNQSQSFVANGTHIAGFNAISGVNAQILLGSSTFTGFDTGINASNFYGSTIEMTGGSINALVTGIRADATGGGSSITSQAAIVAPTGIHSTNTNGTTITTSGAGTINSTVAGTGTGILATSSGGTNAIAINVGAAIGNATAPAIGVSATTTGGSGAINITTTAAITATSRGLEVAGAAVGTTGTINIGADISAATAVYTNIGSYTVNVAAGVNINSTANSSAGLYLVNGTINATNNGTIVSTGTGTAAAGVRFSNPNGTLTNSATGSITGLNGAYLQNGPTTVTNAGTITGTGGLNTAGVRLGGGGSVNNSNAISGYDAIWSSFGGTLTNSGTLSGVANGVNITGGAVALTNTGTISTVGGTGGAGLAGVVINSTYVFGTGTITNSGAITGGGDATHGYGVEILDGLITLTNQSGGAITGGQGAILLSSNEQATLNLELGSTVTGDIVSEDTGARAVTVNGVLTGDFEGAAGSGVVAFILGSTGSIQGVTLGAGNDIFTYQGGTFAGTISGGTGTDSLLVDLGSTAVSRSIDLADLSDFDTYRLVSGSLTLTGSRDGGAGWLIDGGTPTSMRLSGSLTNVAGSAFTLTTADALTLNLGSQVSATGHVIYSAVNGNNIQNAGTITSGSGAVSGINIGSGTVGNTGTITYSGGLITDAGYGVNTTTSNLTLTNSAAASITGRWAGVRADAGGIVTNTGRIQGDRFAGVELAGASTVTNNSGGVIYGATGEGAGVLINSGNVTVTNNSTGLIVGGGAGGVQNRGAGTVTVNNSGILGAGSVDGAGAFTQGGSGSAAVGAAGILNVNNLVGGSLTGALAGVRTTGGTTNTSNAGTISAATAGGYGVVLDGGSMSLTNLSGGDISGALGSFLLGGTGSATIDLQAGSTATGSIVATGSGTRTLVLAGALSGNLDATGNSGAVNLTLNTSATGYTLLHAGSGTDSLTFSGSGSRSFSVDNLSGWETGSFTGGSWTLTGTGNQNSFTSGVTINGAALTISNTQQFQGSTGLTLTGNGSITTTASLSNTRTLAMTGAGTLNAASGQTLTQSGVVSGAGVLSLSGLGTVLLSGNNTYTGGTVVNSGILRLGHTSGAGTGVIRMIDPQIDFAATGTYNNPISLEVVDGQQAADPTILNNTSGGAITLAGRIYETTGVGGAGQYVTFNGGSITLTNGLNGWAGVTRINSGATLLGTTASISGASIVNNGTLTYQNTAAGTASQNISGSGAININGTDVTLAGAITTTGQLTVSGPGSSLILGGSRSGASNTGVFLSATGGSLTVANGASLLSGQYNGVRVTGANASVTNLGLIQNAGTGGDGGVGAGVYIQNGGAGGTTTINNGSLTDTGAGSTIQGFNAGIRHESGSTDLLVINNYGLIVGDVWNGIENTAGGLTVNNFAGGYITTAVGNGVGSASSSAVSVTNAGTIGRNIAGTVTVGGYGVSTSGVLTLNNQSGGEIYGTLGGIQTNAASASITNGGTISGALGVLLNAGGTVANQAGGLILATDGYGVRAISGGLTLTNGGVIRSVGGAGVTATAVNTNGVSSLTNNAGGVIAGAYNGATLAGGVNTVINNGVIAGVQNGISGSGFAHSITNSGVIVAGAVTDAATSLAGADRSSAPTSATGVTLVNGGTVTNLATGEIAGRAAGVRLVNGGTVVNAGLIDASGVLGADAGVLLDAGGVVTNQLGGTISGALFGVRSSTGALTLTNAGTITGASEGVSSVGALTMTNTGSVSATSFAGVTFHGAGSLDNYGSVTGGAGYFGVQNNSASGTTTIINRSGGAISGGTGSILITGAGATTIDLQAGSTATGQIIATSTGTRTVTVAGVLDGVYDGANGANTGVDNLTLASTGSMTSAILGAGADSFIYQGGSFSGFIDAGTGTDSLISNLAGGSASLNFSNLGFFETFAHQSGTLTTTGTGIFAAGVSVQGGALIVDGDLLGAVGVASGAALSGGGSIAGPVTVADGGALIGSQGDTLTMSSLSLASGSTINATFSGAGGPALFAVTGDLILDGTVNIASTGAYGFGVYGLMTYGGALTDNGLAVGTTPGGAQRVSVQTSVAGQINIVHAPNELLFWDGGNGAQHDNGAVNGGSGVWTAAGSNWTDAGGLYNGAMEPQPGFAIFQAPGGTVTVDDVDGLVSVTGMQFAADGYRIEGDAITLADPATVIRVGDGTAPGAGWSATIASALTGAGGLVKTDLGTLILAGDSDYTGGTTVDAGTLQIGDGATAGSIAGPVVLANSSTLVFSRNDNHDFANAVSGAGSVGVNGVVTLSGAITASGGVDVYSGGEATVSNVNVASGSAVHLAGNALLTVASGGSVVSQDGTGVESLGSSVYNYGSIQGTAQGVLTTGGSVWNYGSASVISGGTGVGSTTGFALSVYNEGTITGSLTAVSSVGNLTLNNIASGTMSGQFAISTLGDLNMANAGAISASVTNFNNSGIYAGGTGAISNTGTITSGTNAIYTQGAGTLTNSGLIQGGGAASTVRLFGANSSVTNLAAGEITTTGTGVGLYLDGINATVVNSGTISGGNAVNFVSGGGTITNDGILIGTVGSGMVGNGVTTVNNLAGGSITGATNGVNFLTGSVTNAGTITGTTGQGLLMQGGGAVANTGVITGGQSGVRSLAALNLTSSGAISGSVNAIESVGAFDDILILQAGSTTTGAVLTAAGADSISLGGTLDGALNAGDGADTVTLLDTASFTSTLDGADGVDAFVLDGSGVGSLDIGQVLNFESRAKNGAGAWVLTGTDASTAAWAVNAGVLAASGGSAINDAAFVNIGAGGTLALLNDETIGALTGSGFVDLDGGRLTLAGAETTTYDGVISGAGGLTIGSAYGLTLTGANTATGATIVNGVLRLGASGVLADASDLLINTGGVVELQGFDETVDSAFINGVLNGPGTLTAGVYALDGGSVQANLGAGLLVNVGGTSTLGGTSNADLVVVDGGTLALGASDRIVDSADLQVSAGATFDLGAYDDTVNVTEINGTLAGTGTLTAVQHQLDGATVNANLAGGSVYVIGGASTLNGLSNADLLSVLSGSLTLGGSDRIVDTATLEVSSGATLNIGGFNEAVAFAGLAGTVNGTGTLTADEYDLDGATINANLGAGDLLNTGGVSTLNGTSDAGLVFVGAGTLTLGASDRLADMATVLVASGATLDVGAFDDTVDLAVLGGALDGTGTLTATDYLLVDATVNANLGAGVMYSLGVSTLNGTAAADDVLVDDGVLTLGAANRLADNALVTVSTGAALNLGAFDETIDLLALNGALNGTGTLTAGEYSLDGATVNANLGAGNLFNVGGVSTLNGLSGAGLVSVQGGTLTLGASDRLADMATVLVASGATLDLGAFNDTVDLALLNGTLAGTGTLTAGQYQLSGATVDANLGAGDLFNTGGVSTLTGTSAAANVVVQAGTLALGASNRLADTATVLVASGSTLDLNAFNDTVGLAVVNGVLAGTGTLTAAQYQLNAATVNVNLGAGTLFNLGGVSTLTGTAGGEQVSINAGTLRLGADERLSDAAIVSVASGATFHVNGFNERIGALFGTGDVNVGAGRLTFGGVESGFGGRLSGTGSLVHTGGLFTLTGDHTIASISNIGGELRFAGTTTGSISASGGSVTGAGTIGGALTASNGAILSPGLAGLQNGIGGFTAGGLTLNGGILAIDVLGTSGGNLIDQLRINGTATLTGGLLAPTFQGAAATDFNFSTRYLFLQANNLVGTFANGGTFTAAAQEGLFWRVRYDLSPNAAVLELRELTDFDPGATGTGNQRGVGQALSGGQLAASDDWAAILSLIAGLNAADRAAAFDSISGEPLADVTTSMFSANDTFLTAVRDGGMGGRNDGGEALNFVDSLSFAGGRENSADRLGDVLGAFDPSASTERGAGGWVSAWSGDQTLDGKPGQARVESSLNGFAGGYGIRNGSMSIGGAGGVTRLEGDVVARRGHYESDLSHAAGYVAFDDGVWAADLSASFYGGDLDTRRGITVGAFSGTASGNTHVEGQALSASVARRFQVTDTGMIALGAIGTASNASVDGYTETGAGGLSLQASGQERDWQSLQLTARATQDYRVNGQGFRIYGGAGVMAIAGDRQATGDMRFTGAPVGFGTFTVEGAEAPPMAGLVDFGLEVGAGEGVTVSAGYRGLFSERLQDNQIGVKLNVSW